MPPAPPRDEDVVTRDPLNVETAWDALQAERTPVDGFYTRNNFPIPQIDADAWRLDLVGFARPLAIDLARLRALPRVEMDLVLECAGNGRTYFSPRPSGTPWRERAVGCATFAGARLADVLREAGVPDGTVEVVFRGGDGGTFERSLPLRAALDGDTLLAWEMNGEPLRPRHGAPVRLVVPGWYGVASVKWLVEARATATPFTGHFQTERYVYQRDAADASPTPVREKRVNSLVTSPRPDEEVAAGAPLEVRGFAWSGAGAIARVDVSVDGGATWSPAELVPARSRHAWAAWRTLVVPRAGEGVVLARAVDAAGNRQPDEPEWNLHGYGYNAPRPRRFVARA